MAEIKFSDEDVNLVAQALWDETRSEFGGTDMPEKPTAVCYSDAKAVLERLAGRLLPPGGEPEWGWRGWSDQDPQRGMPLRDEAAAREVVAAHPGTELVCRQVGPWSPVVSDNSEVPNEAP